MPAWLQTHGNTPRHRRGKELPSSRLPSCQEVFKHPQCAARDQAVLADIDAFQPGELFHFTRGSQGCQHDSGFMIHDS